MGLRLFVPAGTIHYWQAWAYLIVYTSASLLPIVYLLRKDRALLARRMNVAEKRMAQKISMFFLSAGFMASLVVPALDHRFGWSSVPLYAVIAGDVLTALWFYISFRVFKENTFAMPTIELAEDHKVISTGPYALVRHPMYSGGLCLSIGTALALGSWWGLLVFVAILPFSLWRIFDEEKFLAENLSGYAEYCAKVRRRLIPGIF